MQDTVIAIRYSYDDVIDRHDDISARFERLIEFLNHKIQPIEFFKDETKALCDCIDTIIQEQKKMYFETTILKTSDADLENERLLDLKLKIMNLC